MAEIINTDSTSLQQKALNFRSWVVIFFSYYVAICAMLLFSTQVERLWFAFLGKRKVAGHILPRVQLGPGYDSPALVFMEKWA
jgi:hypothetical protein